MELKKLVPQVISVCIATMSMLIDGMQFGWSSPGIPQLKLNTTHIHISKYQGGIATRCYIYGIFPSALLAPYVFSQVSKKKAVMICCIPMFLAFVTLITANSVLQLYIGRMLGGMGKNMVYVSVPLYIGEIAEPAVRGMLGCFMNTMMNVGVFLSYAIVPRTPYYIIFVVAISIIVLQLGLCYFLPPTPYYLIQQMEDEEAEKVLKYLRNTDNISGELRHIRSGVLREKDHPTEFFKAVKELFVKKSNQKALVILLFLRGTQALGGIGAITMNIHQVFLGVSGGRISAYASSLIYCSQMILSTFFSMSITERFSRRSLMLFSSTGSALLLALEGLFFYFQTETKVETEKWSFIPLVCTFIYVYVYRVGLGTVPIVMVGELFPANVKIAGAAIVDVANAVGNLISLLVYYYMEDGYGIFAPFLAYSCVCASTFVFSFFFLPETRGKSLEQIQRMMQGLPDPTEDEWDLMNKEYEKERAAAAAERAKAAAAADKTKAATPAKP